MSTIQSPKWESYIDCVSDARVAVWLLLFWKCGSSGFLENKLLNGWEESCRELRGGGAASIPLLLILFTHISHQLFLFLSLFYSLISQSVGVGVVCTIGAVAAAVAAQQEIVIMGNVGVDSYLSLYVALL